MNKEYLFRGGQKLGLIRGKAPLHAVAIPTGKPAPQKPATRHAIIVAGSFRFIQGIKYEIGSELEAGKKEIRFARTEELEFDGEKLTAFIAEEQILQTG